MVAQIGLMMAGLELPWKERSAGMERLGVMVLVRYVRSDQVVSSEGRVSRGDAGVVLCWGIGEDARERSGGRRLGVLEEEEVVVEGSEKLTLRTSSAELFITWKILLS